MSVGACRGCVCSECEFCKLVVGLGMGAGGKVCVCGCGCV